MGLSVTAKECAAAFLRDETGATAIEYGLIAIGIGIAIIQSVYAIGPALEGVFQQVDTGLQPAGG